MIHTKLVCAAMWLSLCVIPAAAQLQLHGLQMGASGDIYAGYTGDTGLSSDHSVSFGGSGDLSGFYYNPNFLYFDVSPYYGRGQDSSGSLQINNALGESTNINIFTGSQYPGSLNFNQNLDNTGVFGIPGAGGLTTTTSNKSFAIGWSVIVPGLPTVSVGFSDGSSSSSVVGTNGQSGGSSRSFSLRSSYRLAGFGLSGGYSHQSTTVNIAGFLNAGGGSSDTSNTYSFNATHNLPLNGAFSASVSRSTYDSQTSSGSQTGANDDASGQVGIKVWRLPLTGGFSYTDNVFGSVQEQLLASGVTESITSTSPKTSSLQLNVGTSYTLFHRVFVTGFASRDEQFLGGQGSGVTQYGANAAYNFLKLFKGLVVMIGLTDNASQVGNSGAALRANVDYNRKFGHWELNSNFNYNQDVQTLLAIYTVSSMQYTVQVRRKFKDGFTLNLGGGGGNSGFSQVAGNESHSNSVNAGVSWHRYNINGNYSQSSGTAVVTQAGLTVVPIPVVNNSAVLFSGTGEGLSASASLFRSLSLSASYSTSNSNTLASAVSSNNRSESITSFLTYNYRKIRFNAGVTSLRQSASGSLTAPASLTSYYFEISRWIRFF